MTRAALYVVVEGNKKCKSKRVGVGEWEKKISGGWEAEEEGPEGVSWRKIERKGVRETTVCAE